MAVTKPTTYQSAYSTAIDDLVNKAVNRQPFEYNPATDAAYQAYARQYTQLGNEGARDTLADVSAQTGGMPSSYAVSAAQQVRNNANQQLTAQIPSLMQAAYEKYRADANDNLATLSALQGLDDAAYNRFATDREFNEDVRRYGIDDAFRNRQQNFTESSWRDEFARRILESDRDYNEDVRRYNQDFNYQVERDKTADAQWDKEFNEKVREYDQNYDLDKNSQTFEQMLNTWTTLGYANKEVAEFFNVKKGTKTNEAAYQAAQLALDKKALAKSGNSGRRSGTRRGRSYTRGSQQSKEDKYGKYIDTPNEGIYKDNPYRQALHIASQKLQNGASYQQVVNYLNTVQGLSKDDIARLKSALGLKDPGKNANKGIQRNQGDKKRATK